MVCLIGLWPHLEAKHSGLQGLPDAKEPLTFIAVEDYGTRGLQGDPAQNADAEIVSEGLKNDFYYFWRNVGRSEKGSTDLGRWGLGKTVFAAASRLNAFFGVTVRGDAPRRLLMGQCVLKIHALEGRRFCPYGYFGLFEGHFARPAADSGLIAQFCDDFGLDRGREFGLSVVVPYPDKDILPEAVLRSVVSHYFFPILSGQLEVEVKTRGEQHVLNAQSVSTLLSEADWKGLGALKRLVELARWGLDQRADAYVPVSEPDEKTAPRWPDQVVDAARLAKAQDAFDRGDRVCFRAPLWVKPIDGEKVRSHFHVYLERDDALKKGESHFVRDGITIAGVRASLPKDVRAIVSVTDEDLSKLLGDSENPAHTQWEERSPKFKGAYEHGPFSLRYVKNAPRELVKLLTRPKGAREETLLRHIFSLDAVEDEALKAKRMRSRYQPGPAGTEDDGGLANRPTSDTKFQLQRLAGGFRLRATPQAESLPDRVRIQVAYDVRRGNPFRLYRLLDFDLRSETIEMAVKGGEIARRGENWIDVRILNHDFALAVRGFDVHRDVRVRVEETAEALV